MRRHRRAPRPRRCPPPPAPSSTIPRSRRRSPAIRSLRGPNTASSRGRRTPSLPQPPRSPAAGYEPIVLGADLEGEARDRRRRAGAHGAAISRRRPASRPRLGRRADRHDSRRRARRPEPGICSGPRPRARRRPRDRRPSPATRTAPTAAAAMPRDPAGALVDPTTLARARAAGLDAAALLADNDSTRFFEGLGDLLVTGPTRTNVNDFRVSSCRKLRRLGLAWVMRPRRGWRISLSARGPRAPSPPRRRPARGRICACAT